jgi:hypothetical protein
VSAPSYLRGLEQAVEQWAERQAAELTLSGRVPGMVGHPYCSGGESPIYTDYLGTDEYAHLAESAWWRADDRRLWHVLHNSDALGLICGLAVIDGFGNLVKVPQ